MQADLFSRDQFQSSRVLGERTVVGEVDWPDLRGVREIALDTETTGRDLYGRDVPVGLSVFTEDRKSWYIAWGHGQGKNRDPERCRAWALDNLRDKTIRFAESKFDIGMLRKFGVDLEEMGVRPEDVQYDLALLDSRRASYALDDMSSQFLGRGKVKLPTDDLKIWERRAEDVDEYARVDVELTWDLVEYFRPRLEAEDLMRVRRLENDLIFSTCHMERSGMLVDVPQMMMMRDTCVRRFQRLVLELEQMVGFRVIPGQKKSMEHLYQKLGVPVDRTPTGQGSFVTEEMEKYWNPKYTSRPLEPMKKLTQAIYVKNLTSKFDSYLESVDDLGIIRFKLHQLKAESEGASAGTVSGRYSTSGRRGEDSERKGFNPQQVFKVDEQYGRESISDLIVKRCFRAPEGMRFWSSDASQIEYRVIGHYVDSPSVTEVYRKNPWQDFHEMLATMAEMKRKDAKHANFALWFGAGLKKFAYMIDRSEAETVPIYNRLHGMFPEIRPFHRKAIKKAETTGYIMTILGRRRRFGVGVDEKYHAAVAAAVSGTAADINKLTVRDLYRERKNLGVDLRLTFHDEELGYGELRSGAECERLYEFMNEQRVQLRIPVLWNLSVGENWELKETVWRADKGQVESSI